eukprot:gene46870-4074_t
MFKKRPAQECSAVPAAVAGLMLAGAGRPVPSGGAAALRFPHRSQRATARAIAAGKGWRAARSVPDRGALRARSPSGTQSAGAALVPFVKGEQGDLPLTEVAAGTRHRDDTI